MPQDLVETQSRLKDEFAKRYRTRSTKSSAEVKDKNERAREHRSLLLGKNQKLIETQSRSLLKERQEKDEEIAKIIKQLSFSIIRKNRVYVVLANVAVKRPDLRKRSVYQKSFLPKKSIESTIIKANQTQPLKGAHLDMKSEYLKKYDNRHAFKVDKPRPDDSLKFQGPSQLLTTYSNFHPGHKGKNQYIKPSDSNVRGQFPMQGRSVYSTEFILKKQGKEGNLRHPDHLKTGSNWLGPTTYGSAFRGSNPEENMVSLPFKRIEKYEKNPGLSRMFESNYQHEYQMKDSSLCPSKLKLQRSPSPDFGSTKNNFRENSDFKSMSPQFKAIATSKHFYV